MDNFTNTNEPGQALKTNELLRVIFTFFAGYVFPFVLLFGTVSNFSSFIIFLRLRRELPSTLSQYLSALSAADSIFVVSKCWLEWWDLYFSLASGQKMPFQIITHSEPICRIIGLIWHFSILASNYLFFTFSIERCYKIVKPLRAMKNITQGRRRYVIIGVFIGSLIGAAWPLGLFGISNHHNTIICENQSKRFQYSFVLALAVAVLELIIPLIGVTITSIIMITSLRKTTTVAENSKKAIDERQILKKLLYISFVLIITTFPITVIVPIYFFKIFNNNVTEGLVLAKIYGGIIGTFQYILKPIIYITIPLFRRKLLCK